jgi:dTDP-4-dehydrorhamnose reductase
MTVLVTGAAGQVGSAMMRQLAERKTSAVGCDLPDFDITDLRQLETRLDAVTPDVVINCAAYNDVNRAEQQPGEARAVNADAVAMLADLCAARRCILVHYSTDYVFDGARRNPYIETDPPNPLGVYARTKLTGERAALERAGDSLVFRLSSVFGAGRQSFFHRLHVQAQAGQPIRAVTDQTGSLTYAEDAAAITLAAIDRGLRGLFHLVNAGSATRFQAAVHFFDALGLPVDVHPAVTADFPNPVRRPVYSVLATTKLETALDSSLPTWQNAVARYCRTLQAPIAA